MSTCISNEGLSEIDGDHILEFTNKSTRFYILFTLAEKELHRFMRNNSSYKLQLLYSFSYKMKNSLSAHLDPH